MTITNPADIQRLVKQNINSVDLASAVEAGDREIVSITNRDIEEWNPSDNAYGRLQQIGALFGAWQILIGWDQTMYLEKSKEMRKAYIYAVEQFKTIRLPDDKTDPNFDIAESVYTHYKLNSEFVPFMSSY